MFTYDSSEREVPPLIAKFPETSSVEGQPEEGLLTGRAADGSEIRKYLAYVFPADERDSSLPVIERARTTVDAAASMCVNGVKRVAGTMQPALRRVGRARAMAGPPSKAMPMDRQWPKPLPPVPHGTEDDVPPTMPATDASEWPDPSSPHSPQPNRAKRDDTRFWEAIWTAAAKGLTVAPPRTLRAAVKVPQPKHIAPQATPRAEWPHITPAERYVLEAAARVDAWEWEEEWRGLNGQWEEGIRKGTHTFDDILTYQKYSTEGRTIGVIDVKALATGAKRLFLGATAIFKPTQAPQPTLEQMQERCLRTYQEEFSALSSRRSYLTAEAARVRALIDQASAIPVKTVGAVARTGIITLFRVAIASLSDGLGEVQGSRGADPDTITGADIANYLGYAAELHSFGEDNASIQAMAFAAAMARAGTYATEDQKEQLRRFLESQVEA